MVEGPRLIAEALDAGAPLEVVFLEGRVVTRLDERLERAKVPWHLVADGALDAAGDARTSQGALAVAVAPPLGRPLSEALSDAGRAGPAQPGRAAAALALVLVEVADPGNVGTMLRTADAAGAAVVLVGPGADVLSPKVVRAAAGATFRVPLCEGPDAPPVLAELRQLGLDTVGTVVRDGTPLDEAPLRGPLAIVVGSEAHGLPPALTARLDRLVTITMPGRAESLNVAMAATVVTFEVLRQRRAANRLDVERAAGQG